VKPLIAIATCDKPQFVAKADAQKATWARLRPDVDIRFFTGKTLGVPDHYEALPQKVRAIFRWALDHDYSHCFKTDDDTFINIDALLEAPVGHYDYVGNTRSVIDGEARVWAYNSGYGYWLSRKAMEVIAHAELTNDPNEDRWVGTVLQRAGIHPMRDPYNYRIIYPGIVDPKLVWMPNSAIGHAAVFAQLPPDMMRLTKEAFDKYSAAYFKTHPKPSVMLERR
jgi:hypothetical protein